VQLDFVNRELTVKLVYYGPALSGKTTNLLSLHQAAQPGASGRLMTLETRDDRTLFFDLLPLRFRGHGGLSVRLKVFTVPGQVIHAATRRLRDMPGVRTEAELAELASQGREPVFLAVATSGFGVVESFVGLLHLTMGSLNATHDLEKKFGFDLSGLLAEVTEKLGRGGDMPAVLGACVGGALDVLRPEAVE
jgi:mutual gliding-motility protein MglA